MRTMSKVLAALVLAGTAHGATDAGDILTPQGAAGEWRPLVASLATKGSIQATFTELRYFPFRHDPMVLHGVLRTSSERGMSLQYIDPVPNVLVADTAGLIIRDQSGRSREISAASREGGAIASLLPIMRFDLPALFPRFVIRVRKSDLGWQFEFTPRDSDAASSLGTIKVAGAGTNVSHLEFKRSESQRVEIEVGKTQAGVVFTPTELAKYFR